MSNPIPICIEREKSYEILNDCDFKDVGSVRISSCGKDLITKDEFEEEVRKDYKSDCITWLGSDAYIEKVDAICDHCREKCLVSIYDFKRYEGKVLCDTCSNLVVYHDIDNNWEEFMSRERTPTGKIPKRQLKKQTSEEKTK